MRLLSWTQTLCFLVLGSIISAQEVEPDACLDLVKDPLSCIKSNCCFLGQDTRAVGSQDDWNVTSSCMSLATVQETFITNVFGSTAELFQTIGKNASTAAEFLSQENVCEYLDYASEGVFKLGAKSTIDEFRNQFCQCRGLSFPPQKGSYSFLAQDSQQTCFDSIKNVTDTELLGDTCKKAGECCLITGQAKNEKGENQEIYQCVSRPFMSYQLWDTGRLIGTQSMLNKTSFCPATFGLWRTTGKYIENMELISDCNCTEMCIPRRLLEVEPLPIETSSTKDAHYFSIVGSESRRTQETTSSDSIPDDSSSDSSSSDGIPPNTLSSSSSDVSGTCKEVGDDLVCSGFNPFVDWCTTKDECCYLRSTTPDGKSKSCTDIPTTKDSSITATDQELMIDNGVFLTFNDETTYCLYKMLATPIQTSYNTIVNDCRCNFGLLPNQHKCYNETAQGQCVKGSGCCWLSIYNSFTKVELSYCFDRAELVSLLKQTEDGEVEFLQRFGSADQQLDESNLCSVMMTGMKNFNPLLSVTACGCQCTHFPFPFPLSPN